MSWNRFSKAAMAGAFIALAIFCANGAVAAESESQSGDGAAEKQADKQTESAQSDHPAPEEPAPRPAPGPGPPFAIRVLFIRAGGADADNDFSGSVEPDRATIQSARAHGHFPPDALEGNAAWSLPTIKAIGRDSFRETGIEFQGRIRPQGQLLFETERGDFQVRPQEMKDGQWAEFLDGRVRVQKVPPAHNLGDPWGQSDFPSIAVGEDGQIWAAWATFIGGRDEIRLAQYNNKRQEWNTFSRAPNITGDVWMPQLIFDGDGRLWLIWAQQREGNFDLYARPFADDAWGPLRRLTRAEGSDINHSLAPDGSGGFYIAWQGWPRPKSDIFLLHFDGKDFGEPLRVTDSADNDWFPSVSVDEDGAAWVAYDSYREGNYNVYLRSAKGGELGEEWVVADSPRYEVNASVACGAGGRVYVAYEQGPINWTKPQGETLDKERALGTKIYTSRQVKVRCLDGGEWKEPSQPLESSLGQGKHSIQRPGLSIDADGRLWARFRRQVNIRATTGRKQMRSCWDECVAYWTGEGWSEAISMTRSFGRISMIAKAVPSDKGLWVVWPTDNRNLQGSIHQANFQDVWAARISPAHDPARVELADVEPAPLEEGQRLWDFAKESADIAAIRGYETEIGGQTHKIYRGDLHRHTELSWDGGGGSDGSIIEFYRYMLDSVDMDFGAITDHQGGGERAYNWWLTEKTSDLFHSPGEFVPLYGYERSATYPDGHRNVFHTKRGVPVVYFFTDPDFRGARPGIGSDVQINDTKMLYETLHRTDGLAISHTSGTRMGTDWRDSDIAIEPVVEIFQGARTSYEYEGAPRSAAVPESGINEASRPESRAGYYPAGFVWNAWAKGIRLGIIASSDHGSTHMSYAMVYSTEMTRDGIVDSIKKRQTYGATDNIILDVRSQGGFMGTAFETKEPPTFEILAIGTAAIARVDVIKDNAIVYTTTPNRREVSMSYTDKDVEPGEHYYYIRVLQEDEEIAWGSPTWVTVEN